MIKQKSVFNPVMGLPDLAKENIGSPVKFEFSVLGSFLTYLKVFLIISYNECLRLEYFSEN